MFGERTERTSGSAIFKVLIVYDKNQKIIYML